MNKLKYIAPVLIAVICFGLQQVKADSFSFDLTGTNLGGYTQAGPFAHVTVTTPSANSTTATISFTSLTNSGNIYLFGDGGSVAVNVSSSFTLNVASITGTNAVAGFTPGPYSNGGAGNEDGFGSFNLTINSQGGYTSTADHITFTLTNTSGTWLNAAAVLALNQVGGSLAAAHIFVTSSPADPNGSAIITGYAAGNGLGINPLGSVPDGGTTVMLLGAALGALGMARRYLKK